MHQSNEQKKLLHESGSIHEDVPFLARFAERIEPWTATGAYDSTSDVWVVDGQPLAIGNDLALGTVTFTRAGGESQDRD